MKQPIVIKLGVLAAMLVALDAEAQVPGVPAGAAAPAAAGVAAPAVGAVPAAPGNLWSYLCPSAAQLKACKDSFCAHPMGQMISAMMMPLTLASGGLITPCCPPNVPDPNDLNKPSTSPEGAAAAIKADEAGAKARRANMRYLGTVDCHYWPEAEAALITGLRTDKNECVRWEAAMSLGRGCCCTKKTIEALAIVVSSSKKDGNPEETSERVKGAAFKALNHCLACFKEKSPELPPEKPVRAAQRPGDIMLPPYYVDLEKEPINRVVAAARQVVVQVSHRPGTTVMPSGNQTMAHILSRADDPRAFPQPAVASTTVAAAGRGTGRPAPANRDLWQLFQNKFGSGSKTSEPPLAPAGPRAGAPSTDARVSPAGNRDLLQLFHNSIAAE